MSYRTVNFYLPPEMEQRFRDSVEGCSKAEWFRYAAMAFMDIGSRDSKVIDALPVTVNGNRWRKHGVNVSLNIYSELMELREFTGEPIYSLASKAVMYRMILESTGARTIPVRFTAEELEQIEAMHMTVPDAVHELLRRYRDDDLGWDA